MFPAAQARGPTCSRRAPRPVFQGHAPREASFGPGQGGRQARCPPIIWHRSRPSPRIRTRRRSRAVRPQSSSVSNRLAHKLLHPAIEVPPASPASRSSRVSLPTGWPRRRWSGLQKKSGQLCIGPHSDSNYPPDFRVGCHCEVSGRVESLTGTAPCRGTGTEEGLMGHRPPPDLWTRRRRGH